MNRKETSKIIAVLMASYPNFLNNKSANEIQATIGVWDEMLVDYSYQDVTIAIKTCIATDKSGFAPSIGQVINKIINFKIAPEQLTEQEAWNIISKAVKNSTYNATEEFNKMPEIVQKLVGSPSQLKEWGQMESSEIQTVVASNFMRSYKIRAASEREVQALPSDVKALINKTFLAIEGVKND